MLRTTLKRAAEVVLGRGLRPWFAKRARGRIAVLAYHNVVPNQHSPGEDRSLHLPRSQFAAQLDALRETHRVLSLDELLDALAGEGGDEERPRALVTFDDAYRGALTVGLDELERRGLPATVFVTPGLLGTEGFWWDRVRWARPGRDGHGDGAPQRSELIRELGGRTDHVVEKARQEGWLAGPPPEHARPVTASELATAAEKHESLTFGGHGWSHANLSALPADERREELARSHSWLGRTLGPAARPVLAYPYGLGSPEAAAAAREVGFRAAFRVTGGLLDPEVDDPFHLPRMNVPAGVSVDGFRLLALGVTT